MSPLAQNTHILKDSHDFISRLNKLILQNSHIISFDVESLFANVPLDYTINLILERIYKNKELDILIPENDLKNYLNCEQKITYFYLMVYFINR